MTRAAPPILTRPFLLVSLASLAYFVADGTSFALVSRFAIGAAPGATRSARASPSAPSASPPWCCGRWPGDSPIGADAGR